MPLVFPIAADARAALATDVKARTQVEAELRAGRPVSLVSEWLRPAPADREALEPSLDDGAASGFVQIYEDDRGRPVIAVTFWKARSETIESPQPRPTADAPAPPLKATARVGRKRHRVADRRQLDLFHGPDQGGHESPDPHNPDVVLVEEEGVGAAFGLASDPSPDPAPRRRRSRKR